MVLLMSSSGLRIGALPGLTVGSINRVHDSGVSKITVYEGDAEEYFTFCTPECTAAIDRCIEHRKEYGEHLTPTSALIRKEYNTAIHGSARGNPKPMKPGSMKKVMADLVNKAGVREKIHATETLKAAQIRYPVKRTHGLRKFFDTQSTLSGVSPLWVEMLEGHDTKLKESYFRPSETDLLEGNDKKYGYISAVDNLTINEENRLKVKLDVTTKERDSALELANNRLAESEAAVRRLQEKQELFDEMLKHPEKLITARHP